MRRIMFGISGAVVLLASLAAGFVVLPSHLAAHAAAAPRQIKAVHTFRVPATECQLRIKAYPDLAKRETSA